MKNFSFSLIYETIKEWRFSILIGKAKWQPYLLMAPAIFVLAVMLGYPLLKGFMLSFTNMNMISFLHPKFIGVDNYISALKSRQLFNDTIRTILWTLINLFFSISIGLFLALMINRKLPGKNIFRVFLMIPWAIPQYIAVLIWKNMFRAQYGAIDIVLNNLGLHGIQWLSDPRWTFIACIVTNIWLGFPFMMSICLGGLQSVPGEVYEAAELDGVSSWSKLKNITLPLLKPVLIPATILSAVWTFNMVNVIFIMTEGTGNDETAILVTRVYTEAFNYFNYGGAAAKSVLIFIGLALFSSVFIKALRGDRGVYE